MGPWGVPGGSPPPPSGAELLSGTPLAPPLPQGIASRGGGYPPPPQHFGPDATPKAFPYPNTRPNRISNRQ